MQSLAAPLKNSKLNINKLDKPTLTMKSYDEFIKIDDNTLKTLLSKQKIYFPKNITHQTLLDYAINKLHGIDFTNNDEKLKDNKIIKINTTPKIIPGEPCPSCKQNTLRKLKLLSSNTYYGYTHCSYCGLYQSPKNQKNTIKETEVKP